MTDSVDDGHDKHTRELPMRIGILGVVLLVASCGGQVNNTDGGTAGDSGGADSTFASPLTGKWVGYIESFQFGDSSDAVTMTLTDNGGVVTGTVFFGTTPLAPPTNPEVGYPPAGLDAREGFNFNALSPVFAAPRLTLQVAASQVWKQWCELQTMIYPNYASASDGGCGSLGGYGCLPNAATQDGTTCAWSSCDHPQWTNIDCGKLKLCVMGPCECTATSCTTAQGSTGGLAFDMQLSTTLDGSVTGLDGNVHNVHLTRH